MPKIKFESRVQPFPHETGRNDPCWCGSGQKFKKCHLGRQQVPATRRPVLLNRLSAEFDRSAGCLHPAAPSGCKGGVIKAHTVQRSTSLNSIAQDGHVLHLAPDHGVRREGVRTASTFRGFCKWHDANAFRELETEPFIGTHAQLAQIGFRTVCQELHKKRSMLRAQPIVRSVDAGRSIAEQHLMQRLLDQFAFGVEIGLREIEEETARWGSALLATDSPVDGLVIELAKGFPLACAGTWCPVFDFQGRRLQSLDEQRLSSCCFATHVASNGVFAVLTWLRPSESGRAIARSLVQADTGQRGEALARLAFTHFENLFMNETWWERLSDETKTLLFSLQATHLPVGGELVPNQAIPGCAAGEFVGSSASFARVIEPTI